MGVGITVIFYVYLKGKFYSEFALLMRTERFYPNFINIIYHNCCYDNVDFYLYSV